MKKPVASLSLLSWFLGIVQGFSAGFTAEDAARMNNVLEVALSPDGRTIAYTLAVPRDPVKGDNGSSWRELHVVNRRGSSRPYITGAVSIGGISWSPDGAMITYLAKRGEDKQTSLYGIPLDGGESRKILQHETSISGYHWSAAGDRFLFVAREKVAESKAKKKGFNAEVYEEEPQNGRLWIARPSEKEGEWSANLVEGIKGAVFSARWSPDRQRIAVAVAPRPFTDDFYMYQRVKIIDAATGELRAEVDHEGKLGPFRWSPDGSKLALLGGAHMNDPSPGRLFVADAVSGEARRLAGDYRPDFAAVEWIDDQSLLFLADDSCLSDFGRLDLESGERRSLGFRNPPVSNALEFSRGSGRIALVGSAPKNGYEVYGARLEGRRVSRLTDSNPWLEEIELAKQEVVTYSARDGETIEGVLIYPLNYKSGDRYPLILAVHGGPESRVGHGWITSYSRPGQFAASEGYFVLYPNYRGSTGRGLGFAMAHQADYAGKEFDDLVDAIDHFDRLGMVDPDRVGVTGGSYGGYASAWCATRHTDRFAASVMFVGISDLISKQGTTDIPDEMFLVHARKRPWDDWQFFLERSPIYYAEQARTPILILHGKDDPRVHPSQSLELYRTLKTLGKVPTRLVWYPGEGHGNRKAAARYDYSLRLMRWMNHYLKGPGGEPPPHPLDYGLVEDDKE